MKKYLENDEDVEILETFQTRLPVVLSGKK